MIRYLAPAYDRHAQLSDPEAATSLRLHLGNLLTRPNSTMNCPTPCSGLAGCANDVKL